MTDYILFKDLDGKYHATPEALNVNAIDPDREEENSEAADNTAGTEEAKKTEAAAVDENGEKVEAEVVSAGEADAEADEDAAPEEKDHTIYYVTNEQQQGQYISMFRAAKMQAFVLDQNIDQPFISQLEAKNEGIHFARIDADVTDTFKSRTGKKAAEELKEKEEEITKILQKALKNDKLKVSLQKLKDKKISAILTVDEQSRRMADMMKMYAANGMGFGADDFAKEGQTLVLNANHPLVKYIMEHGEDKNAKLIGEQLYDLAQLQNAPLSAEEMAKFVARSNEIMMVLAQ